MKNPPTGICRAPRCARRCKPKSPWCGRCANRQWKAKHPLRYSFSSLRVRARQRGHAFELTFDDYVTFAKATGYDQLKGKTKTSLSIDRIDPAKGYRRDNIRAVTLSENSRFRYSRMPGWMKEEYEKELAKTSPEPEAPAHDCS